jgi:SNF2 family DNA or RNA helicase
MKVMEEENMKNLLLTDYPTIASESWLDRFMPLSVKEVNDFIVIAGFQTVNFVKYIEKKYKTTRITNHMYTTLEPYRIKFRKFFAIEFLYLLNEALKPATTNKDRYFGNKTTLKKCMDLLYQNTWVKRLNIDYKNEMDFNKLKNLKLTLKDYQLEFIEDIYVQKKAKFNLNGYLLALFMGGGKTVCSISLMYMLNKQKVIIICPKATIDKAWKDDIHKLFGPDHKFKIWTSTSNNLLSTNYDYYILNYEAVDKLNRIAQEFTTYDTSLIVDESHNLKDYNSLRTRMILNFVKEAKIQDVLLMSGTPIKALGVEVIPILKFLDPLFTPEVEEEFKQIFGVSVAVATDMLNHRLGNYIFRKLKEEVLSLPPKTVEDVYITIPNGEKYSLISVQNTIKDFIKERNNYYSSNYHIYKTMYENALRKFEATLVSYSDREAYELYKRRVTEIKKLSPFDVRFKELSQIINKYEHEVIGPKLSGQDKKNFMDSKTVIKYVNLKIQGEVLGGLLNRLRSEMFQEMIKHSNLLNIIETAAKKTVCFTTFLDVANITYKYCEDNKLMPLLVNGETMKNINSILGSFKNDPKSNPLIATIQTLSTGVTLIEANVVVFLSGVWRSVDWAQASDRIHRIGQDTPCFIYNYILKTQDPANLSTRMDDVMKWSEDMFQQIVGTKVTNEELNDPCISDIMHVYDEDPTLRLLDHLTTSVTSYENYSIFDINKLICNYLKYHSEEIKVPRIISEEGPCFYPILFKEHDKWYWFDFKLHGRKTIHGSFDSYYDSVNIVLKHLSKLDNFKLKTIDHNYLV